MNLDEIKKVLNETLNKELSDGKKRNIVFWYDEQGEFEEEINELELENAKILMLSDNNSFFIKYQLEKVDTTSNYLIYSKNEKPSSRENFLLDILKYSSEFSTDKTTVIMRNLGVKESSLKNIFKSYMKFFNNKERYKKFASYEIEDYSEEKVHIALLCAICKLNLIDFELVIKTLIKEELKEKNKFLEDIEKFADLQVFWNLVENKYGYKLEEKSLENLISMFMITHLNHSLESKTPSTWEKYMSSNESNSIVFMSHFMNDLNDKEYFDKLSETVASKLKLNEHLNKLDIENYIDCDTFKVFDEEIISKLITNLIENVGEFEKYRKIINSRKSKRWFMHFEKEYNALYYAMEIFNMEKELEKSIKGINSFEIIENYTTKYYLLDMFYRKFYVSYDKIQNKEIFISLCEKVENTYSNWYLDELSIKWAMAVEDELTSDWNIKGLMHQQDFYNNYILNHLRKDERVFVIISDALRYEGAKELVDVLSSNIRGTTEINYMQGVLPSYTKLGMASLLPNKKIEINDNGDVYVDNINTQGTENRERILQSYCNESIAVQFDDIKDMKRDGYKSLLEGKKLVYIYHNKIDARGDHSSTEDEVFEAMDKTFEDVTILIKNLINNVSATNIYITADHGFIYRRSALKESDKISKEKIDVIYENKRFILTKDNASIDKTISVSMDYILGSNSDIKAIVPRGENRFKVQGSGANYVHGGLSPQEIVIPVIKFKNVRDDKFRAKKVEVKLTNISRKITNRITRLEFFQTEKVEDKKLPLNLKAYFVDEEGNRISNENIIIADSRTADPNERTFKEKFTLRDILYDKTKKYYLILEDENENIEKIYEKIPFTIDLIITNDFGF